jgi:hypothetical protein
MIRDREGLPFSCLAYPAQFDVTAPLGKDKEAKALKDRGDFSPG